MNFMIVWLLWPPVNMLIQCIYSGNFLLISALSHDVIMLDIVLLSGEGGEGGI